eukprot:134521_1
MSNTVPDFCHAVQCYGEPPQWPSRDCKCLQKLKTAMICARNSIDSIDIQDVLNNFIHLITEHDDAQSFESIYYRFGGYCDLENCDTFKRHHQKHYNISRTSESDTDEHVAIAFAQILDTMHCYIHHSYDIGYRLTCHQRQSLKKNMNAPFVNIKKNTNSDLNILKQRRNRYCLQNMNTPDLICEILRGYIPTSLTQNIPIEILYLMTQMVSNDTDLYAFGYVFDYDSKSIDIETNNADDPIPNHCCIGAVTYKYSNLKQELVSNEITTLSMDQFCIQICKCKIYFNSHYCNEIRTNITDRSLGMDDILCVMIYCNYTAFHREFSRTYRKMNINDTRHDIKERHRNFYWVARQLKECVNLFGEKATVSKGIVFYHGIATELQFPRLTIYCPVSATASLEVATQSTEGLLVEFGVSMDYVGASAYFPCHWLSDYGNEKECLFLIQEQRQLNIANIISTKYGAQFSVFLQSLQLLNGALHVNEMKLRQIKCKVQITRNEKRILEPYVDPNDARYQSEYELVWMGRCGLNKQDSGSYGIAHEVLKGIVCKLIEHELHTRDANKYAHYKSSEMHRYGLQLFRQFCIHQQSIALNYVLLQLSGLTELRMYFWREASIETPNIDLIKDLFPNARSIEINGGLASHHEFHSVDINLQKEKIT